VDVAEEVGGEFVVAGGKAAAVLETAELALDGIAALVEGLAEAAFPAPVTLGRDVGDRALLFDQVADAVAVISAAIDVALCRLLGRYSDADARMSA